MLRVHCVQLCYNLSDPAMEVESRCAASADSTQWADPRSRRSCTFVISWSEACCRRHLESRGLRLQAGTVDAHHRRAVLGAEMHQTKSNEWQLGMKLHRRHGSDTPCTTAANRRTPELASAVAPEREAWGDAGYQGVRRPELADSEDEPLGRNASRPPPAPPHSPSASVERASLSSVPLPQATATAVWPRAAGPVARLRQSVDRRRNWLNRGGLRPSPSAPHRRPTGPSDGSSAKPTALRQPHAVSTKFANRLLFRAS